VGDRSQLSSTRTVQWRQREGSCPSTVMSLESGTELCGNTTTAWKQLPGAPYDSA
jgi:hypothetical protein